MFQTVLACNLIATVNIKRHKKPTDETESRSNERWCFIIFTVCRESDIKFVDGRRNVHSTQVSMFYGQNFIFIDGLN